MVSVAFIVVTPGWNCPKLQGFVKRFHRPQRDWEGMIYSSLPVKIISSSPPFCMAPFRKTSKKSMAASQELFRYHAGQVHELTGIPQGASYVLHDIFRMRHEWYGTVSTCAFLGTYGWYGTLGGVGALATVGMVGTVRLVRLVRYAVIPSVPTVPSAPTVPSLPYLVYRQYEAPIFCSFCLAIVLSAYLFSRVSWFQRGIHFYVIFHGCCPEYPQPSPVPHRGPLCQL